jgi:tetratricopeptide (TPR) repeat protein
MKGPSRLLLFSLICFSSCASLGGVTSADEYFSLGMAYYDMGKYAEAEKWLNRARIMDKTKTASEYNLGRIAFETGRYDDAVKLFERVLVKDKENIMALKAAAYSLIKNGELTRAEDMYKRVLALEPDSVDDGYNYALVLMALEKPEPAEEILLKYKITMVDNKDTLLLLAKAQWAQKKVEAADTYSQWLEGNSDSAVRYEYAQVLEFGQFYARAIEEYRKVIDAVANQPAMAAGGTPVIPERSAVRFSLAHLLLLADPEKDDGITELEAAVSDGFSDGEKLNALLEEAGISAAHKTEIRRIIMDLEKVKAEEAHEKAATEEDNVESETDVQGGSGGSGEGQ